MRAVGAEGQRAVGRVADLDRGQAVAVGVGVVGQDARGGHDLGRVLGRAVAVGSATGASLTELTVTVTVAALESTVPSLAL